MPKAAVCPNCNQHYLFIDNSEEIDERALKNLEFDESGQGLVSRIWKELEVGDQLNVLAFDPDTFDTVYLSKGELVKPLDPKDIKELIQGRRLVEVEFSKITEMIKAVLEGLLGQGMGQTRVMEGLYDLGIAISNHRASFRKKDGSQFEYRVVLVSDLLEHSDLYDAYSHDRLDFGEWSREPRARAGIADLRDVRVDIYKLQRGISSQNESLEKFWANYFNASGAYPVKEKDF